MGVIASHRGLLSDENVFELIQKWLEVSSPMATINKVQNHKTTSKVMPIHTNLR